jgi:hypothetical protein
MEVQSMQALTKEERQIARAKWKEYVDAEKHPGVHKDTKPLYKDLKKLYHQMKVGRVIIDIAQVIRDGGLHPNYTPKLAITRANAKEVILKYWNDGSLVYSPRQWSHFYKKFASDDVALHQCLPAIPKQYWNNERMRSGYAFNDSLASNGGIHCSAPVPLIPPKHLPVKMTDDYYILWEVDKWTNVAPKDPWLLRRITKRHFIVLAAWDLTDLERSVMNMQLQS